MISRLLAAALLLSVAAFGAADEFARGLTIIRDRWGVPHIYGPTDAGVVFGLMYAQAEDNFEQLEDDYIRALGREAEVEGETGLIADLLHRAFEVERGAREEYASMDADERRLCDAFAAGLNHYLKKHPHVKPKLLDHFEPWFILAMQRSAGISRVAPLARLTRDEILAAFPELHAPTARLPEPEQVLDAGSNMWALAPRRSASGAPLLLINPHVGFFGGGQRYEAHLESRERLRVSGFAILGTPYIRSGFTRHHAWGHTNNNADFIDHWAEVFDDPHDPLRYKHGAEYGTAETWTDDLQAKTGAVMATHRVTFRKTHHGPVVAVRDGKLITARVTGHDRGGQLEQRVAFARARNLREFQAALALRAIWGSNTIYADREGNIFYIHGSLLPRRDDRLDWSKIQDGADSAAGWQGYHDIADFPQLLNPPSGYLQNSNASALHMAGENSLDASSYSRLLAPEPDTVRARSGRRVLESRDRFTFEQWQEAALDTTVQAALEQLPGRLETLQDAPEMLRPLVDELRAWDFISRIDSVATTLFLRMAPLIEKKMAPAAALEEVKSSLEKEHGTWRVPWGEIARLQRIHSSGTQEKFSDERPSWAVAGGPGTQGMLFVFNTRRDDGNKRHYGVSGNTYIAVVELGRRRSRAKSLLVFGQSADPRSPHYTDQAPLYSEKRFKDAWLEKKDVRRNKSREYRP